MSFQYDYRNPATVADTVLGYLSEARKNGYSEFVVKRDLNQLFEEIITSIEEKAQEESDNEYKAEIERLQEDYNTCDLKGYLDDIREALDNIEDLVR